MDDYDYVNLDSREVVAKQREELRASLPHELRSSYDLLVNEADNAAIQMPPTTPTPMDPNDKQLLAFYAAQVITHGAHLTHAIDAFLQTVEHNQPPKVSYIIQYQNYSTFSHSTSPTRVIFMITTSQDILSQDISLDCEDQLFLRFPLKNENTEIS